MKNNEKNIAVIFTYHNRKESTIRCLYTLFNQILVKNGKVKLHIYACDDGSTDGTSETIKKKFPNDVTIIPGSGNLYWARGMYLALKKAQEEKYHFYLMINDDVYFKSDMLEIMLNSYDHVNKKCCAVTGPTEDKETGQYTYGGLVCKREFKIFHEKQSAVYPSYPERECHLSNWNCFLISQEYYKKIGSIDNYYVHSLADFDYSRRIRLSGGSIFVACDYIGYCKKNSIENTWQDPTLSIITRLKLANSIKAMPVRSYAHYYKKFYGFLWPLKLILLYISIIQNCIRN